MQGKAIFFTILATLSGFSLLAGEQKVVLKNGKSFQVKVASNGSPLPFKNDKIEIQNGGPTVAPAKQLTLAKPPPTKEACIFIIFGKFKGIGKYKVTITSPIDDSIKAISEVTGPGQFYFQGIEASEFPAAWTWLSEPGEAWIPLSIKFENENPKETFGFLQWITVPESSKVLIKNMIAKIKSEK